MYNAVEVRKDIFWVGALDYHIRTFDIVMHTDYGTTYNSYIVKGTDKTVLFEMSKETFYHQFIERVSSTTDPAKIDYIVVSHAEPDHAGVIAKLLTVNPDVVIVGTATCIKFLKNIANMEFKSLAVKNGDTLNIGGKTLQFIVAPFLHWPDTMYTYIAEEKTIFTCDSFGCHYCDDRLFNDKIEGDFMDAYKYYFDMIMGPFKPFVLEALNKIKDLDIETICNGHGPIIRKDPQKYMELYRQWATVQKRSKPSVVIPYVTSYGYTKKLAEKIAEGIKASGDIDVLLFDLIKSDKEVVLNEISQAAGVLFGTPTIVGDTLPPIWGVLTELNPIIHKGKLAGAFGSFGWSGEAVGNVMDRLKQLRFRTPLEGFKVCFNPSESDLEGAFDFGRNFGCEVLESI